MSKKTKWKMKDVELIKRIQEGDSNAFDDLVRRHYPETYELFYRMAGDKMLTDDLCQETYLRVFRGLKKFRFNSEFKTWLYRISINVANSYFRKEKLRSMLFSEKKYENIPINPEFGENQLYPSLWHAIGKLPRRQRMVIILRIFQQLSFRDVANVIGITENSAKVNYHYAIRHLKRELEAIS